MSTRAMGADSSQFAELYRRFAPAVHRRALSLLRDPQEALDVAQETFLAYWNGQERLRGEAAPFTVLYQIATYQALDRLRRRSRWHGRLGELTAPDEEEKAEAALEASTAHAGGAEQVEAAQDLALLTQGEDPRTMAAAVLYFVEGHTTEEVAEVLDLSRKTVGKLLERFVDRAKKRAARFLADGGSP